MGAQVVVQLTILFLGFCLGIYPRNPGIRPNRFLRFWEMGFQQLGRGCVQMVR